MYLPCSDHPTVRLEISYSAVTDDSWYFHVPSSMPGALFAGFHQDPEVILARIEFQNLFSQRF